MLINIDVCQTHAPLFHVWVGGFCAKYGGIYFSSSYFGETKILIVHHLRLNCLCLVLYDAKDE